MEYIKATEPEEIRYIHKRKRKAFRESLAFLLCRIFPIRKNLISVCTFEGKGGMGCNAKPLIEELHDRNSGYEFVWFVNDMNKSFPDYIRPVPNTLWHRAYWLSRSAVWIDNYRKPYGTIKRKGQYYLNVNHYTVAIKCTGLLRGRGFSEMAYLVSRNDSGMIDKMVIDSGWCEACFDKALIYNGEFLKTGAPRCDVLYGDRTKYKEAFKRRHHLPVNARVLMFAPTFREGARGGKRFVFSQAWSIDFERLLENLERKFGGAWYLCIRVHPQLSGSFQGYRNGRLQDRLLDESRADDMYGILAGMDAYMTDYSSAVFEAGFGHIPAFIYADDIRKYADDRGSLMWNLTTDSLERVTNNKEFTPGINAFLPFSVATDNDELEKNIMDFSQEEYDRKLDAFHKEIGLVFNGKASVAVADEIVMWMESPGGKDGKNR